MPVTEDIRDIFSILHDGTITAWSGNTTCLTLTVDCQYLAGRIDPSFTSFFLELNEIDRLRLKPWALPIGSPIPDLTGFEKIFQGELEILSAEIDQHAVTIACNCHDSSLSYSGGYLTVSCETIRVFDQQRSPVPVDYLKGLCEDYWNEKR